MGCSIIFRVIFCIIYLAFFNNYTASIREFSLTSIATICPILFEAFCLCLESEKGNYKRVTGIVAGGGSIILAILVWTLVNNTSKIQFTGIPYIKIIISQEIMWFLLLTYLLSPLAYTFFIRKGEYT